ncbi:MAG: hypothetical protein FWD61_12870 [Phycisphaerales bacterium]|nr:hypothetical protein [Phycisphaerales bacterium]
MNSDEKQIRLAAVSVFRGRERLVDARGVRLAMASVSALVGPSGSGNDRSVVVLADS